MICLKNYSFGVKQQSPAYPLPWLGKVLLVIAFLGFILTFANYIMLWTKLSLYTSSKSVAMIKTETSYSMDSNFIFWKSEGATCMNLVALNCYYGKSAWSFFHFLLIIYVMACTNISFYTKYLLLWKGGFILINVPWLALRTKIYMVFTLENWS